MTQPCPKCLGTGRVVDQGCLGAWIRKKRQMNGLQLKELAEKLDISPQYLIDLEKGRRNWTLELKAKADRILKV